MVTFTGTNLGPPGGARCSLETDGTMIDAFCTSNTATCTLLNTSARGEHTCKLHTSLQFCTGGADVCHSSADCIYDNGGAVAGLPGPQGPAGPAGPKGDQGATG